MMSGKVAQRRLFAAILTVIMLVSGAIPAYAGFSSNYTLSGTAADKMVAVAAAQIGRSKGTMGYSDSWCARFVSDVASIAGESAAVPYNAGCRQLYNAIVGAGGYDVSAPQKGDIVFFVCTKCKVSGYNNAFSHVGIMLDGSGTCISGNYNGKVSQHSVTSYAYEPHDVRSGAVILKYVRPNYTGGSTPAPAPQPTPPSTSDALVASTNAISVKVGQSTTVSLTVNRAEKFTVGVDIADLSVCGGKWNYAQFQGSGSRWTSSIDFTGLKAGKTTIAIKLYDVRSGALLDTENVAVEVIGDAPNTDWRLGTWMSLKGKGYSASQAESERLSQGKVGQSVYFWFKAFDKISGKLFKEFYPSTSYKVNMVVTDPAGKQVYSYDYDSSDNNWIMFTPSAAGTYTCKVTLSGGLQGSAELKFPVTADKPVITPDRTALTVEAGKSVTCNVSVIPNGGSRVEKSIADESICSAAWGQITKSGGTYTVPMTVTGRQAGSTKLSFWVQDAGKNRMGSIEIPVTVTAPVSPPTIKLDKNVLEVYVGDKGAVKADFQLNGNSCTAEFAVNDASVCTASWSESGTSSKTLSIAGMKEGSTAITVTLNDSGGKVLASQVIKVTVKAKPKAEPKPLTLSVSPASMKMRMTDIPQQLDISWSGTVPKGCQISIETQGNAAHAQIHSRSASSRKLLIYPDQAGAATLNIAIKNKSTNAVLAQKSVTVTVANEDPKITLERSSVALSIGESITVGGRVSGAVNSGDYYWSCEWNPGDGDSASPPAEVWTVSSIADSSYCGIALEGKRAGSGTVALQLYESSSGRLVAEAQCYVQVSNIIVDDISSPDDWWYTLTALAYAGSDLIEEDIESTEDGEEQGGGTVSAMGTGTAIVVPAPGYSAEGSANLTMTPSEVPKPSNENLSLGAASEAVEAPESTVTIASGGAGDKTGALASVSGGEGSAAAFTDVSSDKYYYEPVMWAQEVGVTGGISGTTLNPNGNCPRGQVVEFIWRAMGCPEPETVDNPFTDVSASDSYYKAVLWAYETNVTTGTGETEFSPAATCTRGQVMTFLWRAKSEPAVSGSNPFTDVADGAYYASAVNWAVGENITTGTSATKFSPNDLCSRAQILTFLYRCMAWEKT